MSCLVVPSLPRSPRPPTGLQVLEQFRQIERQLSIPLCCNSTQLCLFCLDISGGRACWTRGVSSWRRQLASVVYDQRLILPTSVAADLARVFLGQRRYTMEANWAHLGYHPLQMIADEHPDVCRIKVDEERGFVVTTHDTGGLVVRDMDTGEVLWSLPQVSIADTENLFCLSDR